MNSGGPDGVRMAKGVPRLKKTKKKQKKNKNNKTKHLPHNTYLPRRPRGAEAAAVGLELGGQVGHGAEAVAGHVLVAVVLREGEHPHHDLAAAWKGV